MKNIAVLICAVALTGLLACHKSNNNNQNTTPPPINSSTPVMGYNLLSKICGIWGGGVTSTTPLGNYPDWVVDFRPISAGQVSAKNELDSANSIFMSFFITYYNNAYRLAFRNGGTFAGSYRISYLLVDSVQETANQSYYRFSDFIKGEKRAYIEVFFRSDSVIIRAFTNKYNTVEPAVLHMDWEAKLQDTTSCAPAKANFNFPQKILVKNLASSFVGDSESIFYAATGDPYPESAQPYLGVSNLGYTVSSSINPPSGKNNYLLITTQPLISNGVPEFQNIIYLSRYVILHGAERTFRFSYMHPGNYYLYAFCDTIGNGTLSSGDYVSIGNVPFTLAPLDSVRDSTQINYQVP